MLKSSSSAALLGSQSAANLLRTDSVRSIADAVAGPQSAVASATTTAGKGLITGAISAVGAAVSGTALSVARKVYPEFLDPISSNMINEDPEFVINVHACIELERTKKVNVTNSEGKTETIEEPVTLDHVKKFWMHFITNFPRFRERVVVREWRWPYWESVGFDFDSHFVQLDVDPKSGKLWTLGTLEEFVSNEFSVGLEKDRPLWKVIFFPKVVMNRGDNASDSESNISSIVLFKYSHTIADGYHILRVLMSDVLEKVAKNRPELIEQFKTGVKTKPNVKKSSTDSQSDTTVSNTNTNNKSSKDRGAVSLDVAKILPAVAKVLLLPDDKPSAVKSARLMNGYAPRVGRWATCVTGIEGLKEAVKCENKLIEKEFKMKKTKNSTSDIPHLTLNDALFGCLSTAISKFAENKQSPLKEDLTAVIWVALKNLNNLYLPNSIVPVEEMSNDTLGNVYVRLPRLKDNKKASVEINRRITSLKGSPEPLLTKQLRGGFGVLPKSLTNLVWPALSNKVSLSVSSLPGPSFDFEFADRKVKNVAFWVPPVGSISLFVTMITFNGRISVALSSDATTLVGSELTVLTQSIVDEIDRFCEVGKGSGSSTGSKTSVSSGVSASATCGESVNKSNSRPRPRARL